MHQKKKKNYAEKKQITKKISVHHHVLHMCVQ